MIELDLDCIALMLSLARNHAHHLTEEIHRATVIGDNCAQIHLARQRELVQAAVAKLWAAWIRRKE
jgi:hypothetical protein